MATTVLYFPNAKFYWKLITHQELSPLPFPVQHFRNFLHVEIGHKCEDFVIITFDVAVNVSWFNSNYSISPDEFIVYTNEPV